MASQMFFNIGLVDMKCASAVLPTDDPSSKTYFWSKIENCTLNTLFPTLQSRFAEQLVPLRVIPRSLRNHPQHYTQRSSATAHLHDTPGVKLTHQVSSWHTRCQVKFLTCGIADSTPSAHAQSDIRGHAFRKWWLFIEASNALRSHD